MAKLTDFGVAKRERADGQQLTGIGQRIGTPRYMAPEQVEGGKVDARTDLFAYGATVYELLAGRRAFDGGSLSAVFHAILFSTPPSLSELRPDVPAELVLLVERLLSKSPGARPSSAAEVIAALDPLLPSTGNPLQEPAAASKIPARPEDVERTKDASHELREFRLFLEEISCELCRFRHTNRDGIPAEQVSTVREVRLGPPGAFADIKVIPGGGSPYFVEIKWGYHKEEMIHRLVRKYGARADSHCGKLIIVTDLAREGDDGEITKQVRRALCPTLEVEIWGERELLRQIEDFFGLRIEGLRNGNYRTIRNSITRAEWAHAFQTESDDALAPTLLWHFSSWTLKRLHDDLGVRPNAILQPGIYRNVAVLMADLCSFSSYVRDSPDDAVVRQMLTTFYSQARQAVLDSGGMLDQFVGDEVIGLFGFPDRRPGYADAAVRCARRLVDVGNSVSEHWQRRIDRVQRSGGVHIGIAIGDLNLMPLRAFSSSHFGFIGDAINMTARLVAAAGPSEILISNGLYHALGMEGQPGRFEELEPVEGKNIGRFRCWRMSNNHGEPEERSARTLDETAPNWERVPTSI